MLSLCHSLGSLTLSRTGTRKARSEKGPTPDCEVEESCHCLTAVSPAATQFTIPIQVGLLRTPNQGVCPEAIVSSARCSHL